MKARVLFLVIITFFSLRSFSQTSISGVINQYSVVDSIYPNNDTIEVATPSLFNIGDTVMVYQAKGAVVRTDITSNWSSLGTVNTVANLGTAGKYEIILVKDTTGNLIITKAPLNNTYDPAGLVQLIRVPSYDNAAVNAELTCQSWDGTTGGVLALFVNDTLTLNANIDVSGKGFRGADGVVGSGVCAETDSVLFQNYFFPGDFTEAGRKGEGIALHPTDTTHKGISPWVNGGGGGNARFAGGGGGGNYANGGRGGFEDTLTCKRLNYLNEDQDGPWEGLHGKSGQGLNRYIDSTTIFLGGGGGSGTRTASLTASTGGNGGAIVILIAKFIKGNNNSIITNGSDVLSVVTASGAGGGAGGTIVFDIDSVNGNLNLLVTGGRGGSTAGIGFNVSGPGGGGGGGVILNGNSALTANVSRDLAPDSAGVLNDLRPAVNTYGATDGNPGALKNDNQVPLTGFLFNSVVNNQQICKNDEPAILTGSNPRGGDGSFVYKWQHKTNVTTWSDISGATNKDFQPPALSDTTYYRRVVTSDGIADTSSFVKIDVHNYIVGNSIFGDDIITCIGNIADTITGTEVALGGDNISYNYIWEYSFDSLSWNNQTPLNDTTFLHGLVTDTTFVRRIVVSGACFDTTSIPVKIIGLPQIPDTILSANQEICRQQIPEEIVGGTPQGGDGVYTVSWEKRTVSTSWTVITDSTRYNLAPSNLIETMYYRRIVQSDDCIAISDSLTVTVLPLIENDSIVNASLIYTCYDTPPVLINGSLPIGGDGSYTYQWQNREDATSWTDIPTDTLKDYQPKAITNKTYYRRLVSSGANDCCTSTTDTIEVDIYSLPIASVSDVVDTICSEEEISLNFSFSSGKLPYILTYNDGETDFVTGTINSGSYIQDLNPATMDTSKIYDYSVASVVDDNGCEATDKTGLAKFTVYGLPVSDAGQNDENCELNLQIGAISSLGSGVWTQVSGPGSTVFEDLSLENSIFTVDVAGSYIYKWKETNWHCVDSSNVAKTLYDAPIDVDAGIDTTLFFTNKYVLNGHYENQDTIVDVITHWEMLTGSGMIENEADKLTNLTGLFDAANTGIIIQWTVSKGVCEDIVDSVNITLKEIFTPTGFSPNGDGINDNLRFHGLENTAQNELIIFNRWGVEIYKMKNYSNESGWDGKNMDGYELPEDTYYYLLSVTDEEGASEIHKGFIIIKRY